MTSILQSELNENELLTISGGAIGSAELYLVSSLLLCGANKGVGATVAVVSYLNTIAIKHIEY